MKFLLPIAFVCLLAGNLRAQQDPLYAQYFNNPLLINPAFAGNNERLFAGLGYRTQWSGMEGAPATFNFNSHIALVDNKVGAGVVVVQDKLGEFKTTQYGGAFSYRLKLADATFSFGMQFGFVQYSTNLKDVQVLNTDPKFTPFSETTFNTGAGLLLKSDRYTLGLSVPQLLANSIATGNETVQLGSQNYYLYGSYLFFLSERVEFKPSTLLRFTQNSQFSADLNLNFTLNKHYTAGVITRSLSTYGLLLQFEMSNLRFGYVFEVPGKSSALNFNTHEISLAIALDVLPSHNHLSSGF